MTKIFLLVVFAASMLFSNSSYSAIPASEIDDEKKYNLGKELFFDPNLSSTKTISCASCHLFSKGGADGLRVSVGVNNQNGVVNSPSIFNTRFNIAQDWIGEYATIKKRTEMAFLSKIEMAGDFKELLKYIDSNENLSSQFKKIYSTVTKDNAFDSIAYYVSNLTTPNSKFDRYISGELDVLNKDEKKGYELFNNYGCVSCHNGVNIGGNMYQKYGLFREDEIIRDENLGRFSITKKEYDKYVFKVPSLRNVSKTAPYAHHGKLESLKDVIKEMGEHQLGVDISKDDIEKIELFLKTLDGDTPNE